MNAQTVQERRGWAPDIGGMVLYSVLVLLVTLLWVYVPASRTSARRDWRAARDGHQRKKRDARYEAPRVHHAARRRGSRVAAGRSRAAGRNDAADRMDRHRHAPRIGVL